MSMVSLIVNFVPIILAIVLHELAHGYAAYRLGDNTAKICGRLTLNPLKHVDLFGTILLPALLYFSQGKARTRQFQQFASLKARPDYCRVGRNCDESGLSRRFRRVAQIYQHSAAKHGTGRYRPVSAQHGRFQRGAGNF